MTRQPREVVDERRQLGEDRDGHNQRLIDWLTAFLAYAQPTPGQLPDTLLGDHVGIRKTFTKGNKVLTNKDLKRARRMARDTGCTIEAALVALAKTSVAAYRGPDVLRKAGGLSAKEQQAVNFAVNHRMDGKDRETDLVVFKALYGATTGRPPGGRIVNSTLDLLTGGR